MIEKREKRKKIFYVPGMISLVLIPLFCLYHFFKVDAFMVYGSLNLMVPDKEEFEKYKIADLRKYKRFNFNDVKLKELDKIKELRFFVRDIVKKYDTINGAKIHFGSKTDYDTFVNVINLVAEEKVPTWALFGNDIYVLTSPKPKPNKNNYRVITCGYYEANKDFWLKEDKERERAYNLSLYKKSWLIFLGYLGIVLLNIFALVKFNKNKNYNQK